MLFLLFEKNVVSYIPDLYVDPLAITHTIHVWYIYLHLVVF